MNDDIYNLNRFRKAQDSIYGKVLIELRGGNKETHWMWFIFPQICGLGQSELAVFYAIDDDYEAVAYLEHPILGKRLKECVEAILALEKKTAVQIFGSPDDKKLKSSMTLFAYISESDSIFHQVLTKYFNGQMDEYTLKILH